MFFNRIPQWTLQRNSQASFFLCVWLTLDDNWTYTVHPALSVSQLACSIDTLGKGSKFSVYIVRLVMGFDARAVTQIQTWCSPAPSPWQPYLCIISGMCLRLPSLQIRGTAMVWSWEHGLSWWHAYVRINPSGNDGGCMYKLANIVFMSNRRNSVLVRWKTSTWKRFLKWCHRQYLCVMSNTFRNDRQWISIHSKKRVSLLCAGGFPNGAIRVDDTSHM